MYFIEICLFIAQLPSGIKTYVYYAYFTAYCSTCVYPVIYIMFNKSFRHAAKSLLFCRNMGHGPTTVSPGKSCTLEKLKYEYF